MKIDSAPPSVTSPAADVPAGQVPAPPATPPKPPGPPAEQSTTPAQPRRPAPFSPGTRRAVLLVGSGLLFLFILRIGGVLTPFLWAIVVSYAFSPMVRALSRRTGLPRAAVVGLVYLVGIGALVALLATAIPRLNDQMTQLARDLPSITSDLQARYFGTHSQPLDVAGFSIDVPQVAQRISDSLNSGLNNFFGGTLTIFTGTIERVTQFLLFMIVTFYLLLDAPKIGGYFARAIPQRHREEVLTVASSMDRVLSQYLRAQLLLIGIMATASFIVLTVMNVRFAIVLAPIVGILEIFPIIGPFAAITLVTLIAIFSPPNFGLSHTTSALIVALVFFTLRQVEDYAVIPNVVGHAIRLHPAVILFAVAVGASQGGALGLFVAVPLTGALKVLGSYIYQKLDLG